jgi:predicted PurR-regulated permease PerM
LDIISAMARHRSSPSASAALWIIAVVLVVYFLRSAQTLLIPIALAVLISYALAPLVTWLERHRIPRLAGAAVVLIAVVGLCGGGAYTLRDDARELARSVPQALRQARQMISSKLVPAEAVIQHATEGTDTSESKSSGKTSELAVGTSGQMPGSFVQRSVGAVFSLAGHLVVIFFLIYFLLISGHHIRTRLVEISGDTERQRTTSIIIDDINTQIQRYLLVLLATAVVVGAATWLVLAWMGVQHAPMWGILAGIFNSIPYFGPVIVAGGLFVVGVVQGGGVTQALQMSGAAIAITSLEGWLITPPLMGKAERMSALAVFLGLLLWTWIWGAWGTILAVPMLVVIKAVADHVDSLRPLGRLMAP